MAEEKEKTTKKDTTKKTTTRKSTTKKTDDKVKDLEKKNEELMAKLSQMMDLVSQLQTQTEAPKPNNNGGLQGNQKVRCYNLTQSMLSSAGNLEGTAKPRLFEKYGDSQLVRISELEEVYNAMPRVLENGLLYIADERVYDYFGIDTEKIYTKSVIDKVAKLETDEDLEILLGLDKIRFDSIVSTIIENMANGKGYDFNKLYRIKTEKGIDIAKMAEDAKLDKKLRSKN